MYPGCSRCPQGIPESLMCLIIRIKFPDPFHLDHKEKKGLKAILFCLYQPV